MNNHLPQLLQSLKTDVLNSLQAKGKTTNQTAAQIIITTDGNKATMQLPGYLEILEKGRGPTSKNAPQSNPSMIQRIKEWCQAKGLPGKAAWAIKKSIDKKGFKGTPGLLSEPLGDENINLRLNQMLNNMATEATTQITNSLNI